jgi:hypothetical protein
MMLQRVGIIIAICILVGCSAEPEIVQDNRREIERLEGLLQNYTVLYDEMIQKDAETRAQVEAALMTTYQPQRQQALARRTIEAFIALGVGLFVSGLFSLVIHLVIMALLNRPRP